jgi:hypothetical protein
MNPITMPVAELKPALAGLGKIIGKRQTLPVLGSVKIERTSTGHIEITGTDLDAAVVGTAARPNARDARAWAPSLPKRENSHRRTPLNSCSSSVNSDSGASTSPRNAAEKERSSSWTTNA